MQIINTLCTFLSLVYEDYRPPPPMSIAILLNLHCIFYTKCYSFCGHKGTKTDQKSSFVKQKKELSSKK